MALEIENVSIAEKCILVHYKRQKQKWWPQFFFFKNLWFGEAREARCGKHRFSFILAISEQCYVCGLWAVPQRLCAMQTSDFDQNSGPGLSSMLGAVPVRDILKDSSLQFAAVGKGTSWTKHAFTASKRLHVEVADRAKRTARESPPERYCCISASGMTPSNNAELFKEPLGKSILSKKCTIVGLSRQSCVQDHLQLH